MIAKKRRATTAKHKGSRKAAPAPARKAKPAPGRRSAAKRVGRAKPRVKVKLKRSTKPAAKPAWAVAVDGPNAELRKLASPEAVSDLLHPGDPSEEACVRAGPGSRPRASPGRGDSPRCGA